MLNAGSEAKCSFTFRRTLDLLLHLVNVFVFWFIVRKKQGPFLFQIDAFPLPKYVMISNSNRTEWSIIQGVIGRVI